MSTISSLPSSLVYSLDVPEVKNFESKFFYNFHVVDEITNDTGKISSIAAKLANISNTVYTKSQLGTLEQSDLKKVPRYVLLTFSKPFKQDFKFGKINGNINLNDVVYEDKFASDSYTTININNLTIEQQTNSNVQVSTKLSQNGYDELFNNIIDTISLNFDDYESSSDYALDSSALSLQNNNFYFTQDLVKKSKFSDLKKLRFDIQVSNNVVYDFYLYASGSYLSNNGLYKQALEIVEKKIPKNPLVITESEFKPSIKVYQDGIETSESINESITPQQIKKTLIGFFIQKVELRTDGTVKSFDEIFLKDSNITAYNDFQVRYGAIYVYKIRALFEILYPAVDSETLKFKIVKSIVTSKPSITYVETTEEVAPPNPIELNFVWDYDRINLNTAEFLPNTKIPLENVGKRGSLMIYWSFPINPQRDIKKFQIFRRKSIDEPFELIKMFDFDDSFVKISNREEFINQDLIESQTIGTIDGSVVAVPVLSYYDDDFYKNSEYIYAVASIDAHGLTSNYSEQRKVKFDVFSNKIETSLVSIAGAPKQFPNLYLAQDLFLDTIKTSYKKNLDIYFSPDCFSVKSGNSNVTSIINIDDVSLKYKFNYINIDKALGKNTTISISKKTA